MVQDALGLIDPLVAAVEDAVRYFFPKQVDVYCQNCRKDLTGEDGAMVSGSGRVYCRSNVVRGWLDGDEVAIAKLCGLFSGAETSVGVDGVPTALPFILDYRTAGQVQRGIRNGAIMHYSRLEETARADDPGTDATSRR